MESVLSKWEKFVLRMRKVGDGKPAIIHVTLVLDKNGDMECWTSPQCTHLEPVSTGSLYTLVEHLRGR